MFLVRPLLKHDEMEIAATHFLWLLILCAVPACSSESEVCAPATRNESLTIHLTASKATYITSPGLPAPYTGNLDYNWTVTAPASSGHEYVLLVQILTFELENVNNESVCSYDSLSIRQPGYSPNTTIVLCGKDKPQNSTFCTRGGTAYIRFQTDANWCYAGFNLSVEVVDLKMTSVPPPCLQHPTTTANGATITANGATYKTFYSSLNTYSTSIRQGPATFAAITSTGGGSSSTGAIVGGVVGGLLATATLLAVVFFKVIRPRLLGVKPTSLNTQEEAHKEAQEEQTPDTRVDQSTEDLLTMQLQREPTFAPTSTQPVQRPSTARVPNESSECSTSS